MKKLLTQLNGLLFLAMMTMSLNAIGSTVNNCNEQAVVTEIYLNIPNDGRVKQNTILTIKTQIESANGVRHAQIIHALNPENNEQAGREAFLKDGKVDVDIIIRGLDILPMLNPFSQASSVRVKIASLISYITVDNISGVFQSNETGVGNSDIATRLVDVSVMDINDSGQTNEGSASAYSIDIQNGNLNDYSNVLRPASKLVSGDVVLYPNPAVGGNFFLKFVNQEFEVMSIQVFNTIGATVYSNNTKFEPSEQLEMHLNEIPAGVYFMRLSTSKGELVRKFNVTR